MKCRNTDSPTNVLLHLPVSSQLLSIQKATLDGDCCLCQRGKKKIECSRYFVLNVLFRVDYEGQQLRERIIDYRILLSRRFIHSLFNFFFKELPSFLFFFTLSNSGLSTDAK